MSDGDLVECDHVRRKFKGANLYAHFNDAHKWYYVGNHRPDEVLLMKMFDSDNSVKARSEYILHSTYKTYKRAKLTNVRTGPCFFPSSVRHGNLQPPQEHRGSRPGLQLPRRRDGLTSRPMWCEVECRHFFIEIDISRHTRE
jgi:hypothetical protein